MARTQIHLGQITLVNTQTNATIVPIDTGEQGVHIGSGALVANQLALYNASGGMVINTNGSAGLVIDTSASGGCTWDIGNSAGLQISDGGVAGGGFGIALTSAGGGPISLVASTDFLIQATLDSPINIISSGTSGNITLQQTSSNVSSALNLINSTGTSATALVIQATAGGIDIDADTGITIGNATAGDITILQNAAVTTNINIVNNTGTGTAAINIQASAGGTTITSQTGILTQNLTSGDIVINNTVGNILPTCVLFGVATSGGLTLTNNTLGNITLLQSSADDIVISASGTGATVDIDADAGITIDNNTSGHILITNGAGGVYITAFPTDYIALFGQQKRTWTQKVAGDSPYTVGSSGEYILLANPAAGNILANLPAAATSSGVVYYIKNNDATATGNTVTVDGNSGETIDGNLTIVLNDLDSITIVCDGSNWFII